ncbi:MAG: hypothetical protein ACYS47_14965 [Planctomycetota bacterium]|jgi:TRAP-type C4-dicarboxylate transport system permease small subunit
MKDAPGLYRTCRACGNDYKASRPACPNCGKPPFTKRSAYAVAGPRMLLLIVFFVFVAWAGYGFLLTPEQYERHRALLFGLPQTVSQVAGTAGAAVFLVVLIVVFLKGRKAKPARKPRAKGDGKAKPT